MRTPLMPLHSEDAASSISSAHTFELGNLSSIASSDLKIPDSSAEQKATVYSGQDIDVDKLKAESFWSRPRALTW